MCGDEPIDHEKKIYNIKLSFLILLICWLLVKPQFVFITLEDGDEPIDREKNHV
jgi:uncharacterized membrane protein YhdT